MIKLLSVPYHLGRAEVGMGAGPGRLLDAGACDVLTAAGYDVSQAHVGLPNEAGHEVGAYFELQATLATAIQQARRAGQFPVVLGGNCSCVLGSVAGVGAAESQGVIWFDGHADANTPETTEGGFLDGMSAAILTGRCWAVMAASIPGFTPLADERVLVGGVRSVDSGEQVLLGASNIAVVPPDGLARPAWSRALSELAGRVGSVHIHVDLDVIDPGDGRANELAPAGGPSLEVLDDAIAGIGQHCTVDSISLTSYNPSVDHDQTALRSALRILRTLAGLVPTAT